MKLLRVVTNAATGIEFPGSGQGNELDGLVLESCYLGMNQHLRFDRVWDCAHAKALRLGAGYVMVTLWLSSCATHDQVTEKESDASIQEVALKNVLLRYDSYVFTAPDDFYSHEKDEAPKVAGIFNEEEGEALLKKIRKRRGFSLETMPSVFCRQGQKGDVQILQEKKYATEYDPVGGPKQGRDFSNTVYKPSKYDTRQIGTTLSFVGETGGQGYHEVNCSVIKTSYVGSVNYGEPFTKKVKGLFGREKEVVVAENEILMPLFDNRRLVSEITIPDGSYVLMSGFKPRVLESNKRLADKLVDVQEEELKNTLVLIRVAAEK